MEFPYVQRIDREFGARRLKVLTIAVKGESAKRVREFFQEVKKTDRVTPTATTLLDASGKAARLYNIVGITPMVYVLDRQGKIVYQKFAYSEENEQELRQQVRRVISHQVR